MQVLWVEPRLWEELVLIWKFPLEALQVNWKCILAGDIVHAKKVIDSLIGLELRQELGSDSKVLPADVPIQVFRVLRKIALKLLNKLLVLNLQVSLLWGWDQLW